MKKRYHLFISGRVQGVFFRANTAREAQSLGLTGWVRNLRDGRVEVVFEGEASAAEAMLHWCRRGTPPAKVDHLEAVEERPESSFICFEIVS